MFEWLVTIGHEKVKLERKRENRLDVHNHKASGPDKCGGWGGGSIEKSRLAPRTSSTGVIYSPLGGGRREKERGRRGKTMVIRGREL